MLAISTMRFILEVEELINLMQIKHSKYKCKTTFVCLWTRQWSRFCTIFPRKKLYCLRFPHHPVLLCIDISLPWELKLIFYIVVRKKQWNKSKIYMIYMDKHVLNREKQKSNSLAALPKNTTHRLHMNSQLNSSYTTISVEAL